MRSNGSLRELLQNVGQFRRYLYLLCAVDRTFRVRVHVSIYGSAVTVETVKYSHVRAKLAQVQVRTIDINRLIYLCTYVGAA